MAAMPLGIDECRKPVVLENTSALNGDGSAAAAGWAAAGFAASGSAATGRAAAGCAAAGRAAAGPTAAAGDSAVARVGGDPDFAPASSGTHRSAAVRTAMGVWRRRCVTGAPDGHACLQTRHDRG